MNTTRSKVDEVVNDILDLFYYDDNFNDFNNILNHSIKIFTVFLSLPMKDMKYDDIFSDILKMVASNEFLQHIKFFERAKDGDVVAIKFIANDLVRCNCDNYRHSEIMLGILPDHKDVIFYIEDTKRTIIDDLTTKKRFSTDYLGEAIKSLGKCEYVLFHPEYSTANGCLVEEAVANKYNKKTFYIKDLYDLNPVIKDKINYTHTRI